MPKKYEPPKPGNRDLPDALVKAAGSVLSPAAGALFSLLQSPLETRRQQWMDIVAHGLEKLENKFDDFKVETIAENEAFVTVMLHASQAAIRNHDSEKREALRNAVLNVACGQAPDEDRQLMFLNLIDSFTPWHMRLLRYFQNPAEFSDARGIMAGALSNVLEQAFPELRGRRDFYDLIANDLFRNGFTNTESLHAMMTGGGLLAKRTTDLGDAFVSFISSPVNDSD